MKKYLIKYYAILIIILFIMDNIVLGNLRASGVLYVGIMILITLLNILMLLKYRDNIKYKGLVILIALLVLIFSKDIYHAIFCVSFIALLIIVGFLESNFIKVLAVLLSIFIFMFNFQLMFAFIIIFGIKKGGNGIYPSMHYYCENNYDVYAYSASAMDEFHYSIGKHYEILNINGIINLSYDIRNEKSQHEYEEFIRKHDCRLVGEK